MRSPGPRVAILYADESGCTLWRCWWPVTALRRQMSYPAQFIHRDSDALPDVAMWADALVLCRLSWDTPDYPKAVRWVDSLHSLGKAVIMELDDDLLSESCLPQTSLINPAGHDVATLDQQRRDRIFALQLCDGVTVPTQRLATVARQYTDKPVQVVPNAIDWAGWRRSCFSAQRRVAGLTIGWIGGKRLDSDFAAMVEAWGRLARRHPDLTFVVAGHHAAPILDAIPPEQLVLLPWLPVRQYPVLYRDFDLGCAPLADVPFNRAKSNIKILEYGAAGAAVVASPTVYGHSLRDGRDGFLATTADEWERALERLVTDSALRRKMTARWAKRVQERYSLASNLYRWPVAWQAIVQNARARQGRRLVAV